jgi:hypothetical protein
VVHAEEPKQPGKIEPITLTVEVFHLEGATQIALESAVINKWGDARLFTPSDDVFAIFVNKLREANALRANNSVSFLVTDQAQGTPIVCTSTANTIKGEESVYMAVSASILASGKSVRVDIRKQTTLRTKQSVPHMREVKTGFDIERGKTLVYRSPLGPPQIGQPIDSELLVRVTQGPPPQQRFFYSEQVSEVGTHRDLSR